MFFILERLLNISLEIPSISHHNAIGLKIKVKVIISVEELVVF